MVLFAVAVPELSAPPKLLILFGVRLSSMHEKPFSDAVRVFCGFHCNASPLCVQHSLGLVCCGGFGPGNCMLELCVMTNVTVA